MFIEPPAATKLRDNSSTTLSMLNDPLDCVPSYRVIVKNEGAKTMKGNLVKLVSLLHRE